MDVDVVIIGGGAAGASLAVALARERLRTVILEPVPPPPPREEWDSRIYTLSPSSVAFLKRIGVWQTLEPARIGRVERMRIFGDDSRSELEFSAYDAGLSELAHTAEAGRLVHALSQSLQRSEGVSILASAPERLDISADRVRIDLRSGGQVTARLCVGADGANSWTRNAAQLEAEGQGYGERGVVANFRCAKPHRQTAFQWFRAQSVLAWLPLPDNAISIVWSLPEDQARDLLALSPADLCQYVADSGGRALGDLELLTPPLSFPLSRLRAKRMIRPRVALIGDAAHVVHPLAGQGMNLALDDAAALAHSVARAARLGDAGDYSSLRRFERARAEDILAMQFLIDGLRRLFNFDGVLAARARNVGLQLTNRVLPLKTMLVRHAAGHRPHLTGDFS
jgi:2-octaprenylphenol hydroxylase